MSSVSIGKNIKLSIFGESHGKYIGGVADGFPYGVSIDLDKLQKFMKRRTPGNNKFVTQRVEEDKIEFLSGIKNNIIMGDPLSLVIENKNANSQEYKDTDGILRPSHVDFPAMIKYGEYIQLEGGGHFSGRLTAIITAFGGIAKQILGKHNIHVLAHLYKIRNILDIEHNFEEDMMNKYKASEENRYSVINEKNIEKIDKIISELKLKGDSTGGIVYNEKADELAKRALLSQGYKTYNDGSIYFIGFQKQDWISMVESLNNEINEENIEYNIRVEESNPKDYLDKLLLIFDGQRVIINCYKGNKSYVQGKQSLLFQKIISLAIEKLPTDNAVIEVLNTYHALTVEKSEVENAFSAILPNFPINEQDTKLRNTLLSAVFNTLIIGYMPDYTYLVTPLFRVMEFYLHRILSDRLGKNTTTSKGKNKFGYFKPNKSTNRYEYNSSKGNLNNNQIDYLNDLYNRYNKMRHPYSHWSENSMDTQVITDIKTAHDIILEGLQFINKYYIMF